jgi:SAM-dependent methyltransferase
MPLPRVTEIAHLLIERCLSTGGRAIDATVGNGHDTLFLARLVGPEGRVDGFDLQSEAIERTRAKTSHLPQVHLHHAGHERIDEWVGGPVDAVMFNLGYLPSGDHSIITRPVSTLPALATAVTLLREGGILAVVVYPAHEGGIEESNEVSRWFHDLPRDRFRVIHHGPLEAPPSKQSPYLLAAWRGR